MARIKDLFHRKKQGILSVFITAGFPKLNDTVPIVQELEAAGADLVEIGIPFSDPVADGPVIQESNTTALQNGMTLKLLLSQVSEIRKTVKIPIILMGYLNPVLQFGMEKFCVAASSAGVDGLILPDLPVAEYERSFRPVVEKNGLAISFLISPTTSDDRIRQIDSLSSAFVYAVSASSTTGAREGFSQDQLGYFERVQSLKLHNPVLIGFGISNHATFSVACKYSSGAIIGSAFINTVKKSTDLSTTIREFVAQLKG